MVSITDLLEKRIFLIILLFTMLSVLINGGHRTGVNKTVGWVWDASNWIYWFSYFSWIILLGYAFLTFKRYRSNKYFSGLHIVLILFSFLIYELLYLNVYWIVIINFLIIITFIVNFMISISLKRKY